MKNLDLFSRYLEQEDPKISLLKSQYDEKNNVCIHTVISVVEQLSNMFQIGLNADSPPKEIVNSLVYLSSKIFLLSEVYNQDLKEKQKKAALKLIDCSSDEFEQLVRLVCSRSGMDAVEAKKFVSDYTEKPYPASCTVSILKNKLSSDFDIPQNEVPF